MDDFDVDDVKSYCDFFHENGLFKYQKKKKINLARIIADMLGYVVIKNVLDQNSLNASIDEV